MDKKRKPVPPKAQQPEPLTWKTLVNELTSGDPARIAERLAAAIKQRLPKLIPDVEEIRTGDGAGIERLSQLVQLLIKELKSGHAERQIFAAEICGELFGACHHLECFTRQLPESIKTVIPAMVSALDTENAGVKLAVLSVLARNAERDPFTICESIRSEILRDANPEILVKGLAVVMACGVEAAEAATPEIVSLIEHSEPAVQIAACRAVGQLEIASHSATPCLVQLMADSDDPAVQAAAAIAIVLLDPQGKLAKDVPKGKSRLTLLHVLQCLGEEGRPLRIKLEKTWRTHPSLSGSRREIAVGKKSAVKPKKIRRGKRADVYDLMEKMTSEDPGCNPETICAAYNRKYPKKERLTLEVLRNCRTYLKRKSAQSHTTGADISAE